MVTQLEADRSNSCTTLISAPTALRSVDCVCLEVYFPRRGKTWNKKVIQECDSKVTVSGMGTLHSQSDRDAINCVEAIDTIKISSQPGGSTFP